MADLLRSKYYESSSSYERGYTAGFNAGMENAIKSGYAHPLNNTVKCDSECHSKTWAAYKRLLNAIHDDDATKMDLRVAIADAIKLLGETPA